MIKFKSAFIQLIISLLLSLGLIFKPSLMIDVFQFNKGNENWLRALGFLMFVLCEGYYAIAKYGNREIVKINLISTLFLGFGFSLFVYLAILPPNIIYFALCYFLISLITIIELRYDKV